MPPVGFEPTISAGERPKTYALDRAATGIGVCTQCHFLLTSPISVLSLVGKIFMLFHADTVLAGPEGSTMVIVYPSLGVFINHILTVISLRLLFTLTAFISALQVGVLKKCKVCEFLKSLTCYACTLDYSINGTTSNILPALPGYSIGIIHQ